MMASLQVSRPFKPRRPHTKSRNGCAYCRRRRIKCDETKPSCLRCSVRNQKCEYPAQQPDNGHSSTHSCRSSLDTDNVFDASFGLSAITPPASISALDDLSASLSVSPISISRAGSVSGRNYMTSLEDQYDDVGDLTASITKDMYLFDHYMQHASCDLESLPSVAYTRKIGLPELAAKNQGILCSIMAVGAACLCMDRLLAHDACSDSESLHSLIAAGDRYHCWALESARIQMQSAEPEDLAESHAHSILLLPYTIARKRINRMLNEQGPDLVVCPSPDYQLERYIDSIDWVIVLRGVSTTGRACWSDNNSPGYTMKPSRKRSTHPSIARHIHLRLSELRATTSVFASTTNTIASKHPLFPVLSGTYTVALEALQHSVEDLSRRSRHQHRMNISAATNDITEAHLSQSLSLIACTTAIDLLWDLAKNLFNPDPVRGNSPPSFPTVDSTIPWLKKYAVMPHYDPSLPAVRTVLAWVNRVPVEFFNLLLRPLPGPKNHRDSPRLDRDIQMLALDIWAHWLVFAILIEHESEFISDLSTPDLTILAPLFRASRSSSPNTSPSPGREHEWWPWSIASVAQQLKNYCG